MKYEDGCNIIVLMTGDGDMVQAVEKVINQKGIWKVEVVGLEHSMSKQLKELADQHPEIVTIRYLNVDQYSYIEYERKREQDQVNKEKEKEKLTKGSKCRYQSRAFND
jgi:hypothetical protein